MAGFELFFRIAVKEPGIPMLEHDILMFGEETRDVVCVEVLGGEVVEAGVFADFVEEEEHVCGAVLWGFWGCVGRIVDVFVEEVVAAGGEAEGFHCNRGRREFEGVAEVD